MNAKEEIIESGRCNGNKWQIYGILRISDRPASLQYLRSLDVAFESSLPQTLLSAQFEFYGLGDSCSTMFLSSFHASATYLVL